MVFLLHMAVSVFSSTLSCTVCYKTLSSEPLRQVRPDPQELVTFTALLDEEVYLEILAKRILNLSAESETRQGKEMRFVFTCSVAEQWDEAKQRRHVLPWAEQSACSRRLELQEVADKG